MPDDQYTYNLAEFVDKSIRKWAGNKRKILEKKLKSNYEAVTNQDYRQKTWKKGEGKEWRSKTWVGFVRIKIWSFYSMLIDTVLKAGKIPFVLEPSPYDEKYMPSEMLDDRDARLERMTAKIESQLKQRNADREYMKKWLSQGYYGMAFSKFNVEDVESVEFKLSLPENIEQFRDPQEAMQYARYQMVKESEAIPGHRYVSIWNMVWDLDADGLQPKDGSDGYAEKIKSSPFDLIGLKGNIGYIDDAIDRAIKDSRDDKDGDSKDVAEHPGRAELQDRKKTIDRFEFYMRAPRKFADEFEKDLKNGVVYLRHVDEIEEAETSGDEVEIMGEIAGKHIIRYIRNDTEKRPHKMGFVERNLDELTGNGISDNMEPVQESLIGMLRAFEDNKNLSANVTAAVKRRFFNDPGQLDTFTPGKNFDISDLCDDARKAYLPIIIPDVGESLMSGISLMRQFNDDVSMIPTIMQGFVLPKQKSDTAYEMQQLTQNAGKYIGQAIRNNDEQFIEPEITDIYEYNMIYGDDEDCKVNCKIAANGFTSFQNKEMRGVRMQQALSLFVANEYLRAYIKVPPHLKIIYESMDEDPNKFIKNDDELAQESQNRTEQEDQAKQEIVEMESAKQAAELQKEATLEKIKHRYELEMEDKEHEHRLIEGGIKQKLSKNSKEGQK